MTTHTRPGIAGEAFPSASPPVGRHAVTGGDDVDTTAATTLDDAFPPGMVAVRERLHRYARRSREPLLILGASGTGKEVAARAIHELSGPQRPFVAVNCAAIPADLQELELFGSAPHAFTGAAPRGREGFLALAGDGILFLDEVGEASAGLQAKLLRVLESGDYRPVGGGAVRHSRCRIVAATHRCLRSRVRQGLFRADLLFRLAVLVLCLPTLAQRRADIPLLMERFLSEANEADTPGPAYPKRFSADAVALYQAHDWPGNVRELRNAVRRACLLADGPEIDARQARAALEVLPGEAPTTTVSDPAADVMVLSLDEALRRCERHHLERALERCQGNRTQAARLLGLGDSHHTLSNRLRRHPDLLARFPGHRRRRGGG